VACGNSTVTAYDNSTVTAWDKVVVSLHSPSSTVTLHDFSVCFNEAKGKVLNKSKSTSTEVIPTRPKTVDEWIEGQGLKHIKDNRDYVVVYKRVSSDFKTQENSPNETLWSIGTTLQHPNWNLSSGECGEGKFHACSRPYFCDEFRSVPSDKYIAIKVNKADMYVWPNAKYPHKVAFRKGKVMYECNKTGKKVQP
jgi:hypothetical protein